MKGRWAGRPGPLVGAVGGAIVLLIVASLVLVATLVAPRSEEVPTEIGGQHVYHVGDRTSFPSSGSFLLYGYAVRVVITCPTVMPQTSAEADLISPCGWVYMSPLPTTGLDRTLPRLAPRGLEVLTPWLDGPAIVIRTHLADPEAAGCPAETRAACDDALVVEAVVWPS
jgi:hypothetical protein